MTVIESGPTSLYEQGSAVNIPLMDSGSIFNGYWGFVKEGIWKITEKLSKINLDAGVDIMLSTEIKEIDTYYYAEDYHQQYLAKNPGGYCGLAGTGVCYAAKSRA